VTDAALLVETGAHLRFDRLVVVHCEPAVQLARLRARDGLDDRSARARIDAQMPVAEKRAFGHFLIDSSGAPEDTSRAADAVLEELRPLAERGSRGAVTPGPLLGGLVHGPRAGPRGLEPEACCGFRPSAGVSSSSRSRRGSSRRRPGPGTRRRGRRHRAARRPPSRRRSSPGRSRRAGRTRTSWRRQRRRSRGSPTSRRHLARRPACSPCCCRTWPCTAAFRRDLEQRAQRHRASAARWGGAIRATRSRPSSKRRARIRTTLRPRARRRRAAEPRARSRARSSERRSARRTLRSPSCSSESAHAAP
jgi:hypothetical protein